MFLLYVDFIARFRLFSFDCIKTIVEKTFRLDIYSAFVEIYVYQLQYCFQ